MVVNTEVVMIVVPETVVVVLRTFVTVIGSIFANAFDTASKR